MDRILRNIILNLLYNIFDTRYYMGRHKIQMIMIQKKKALIMHLENGFVGNKKIGYKQVKKKDTDICLIRHCYKNKRKI